MNQILQAPFQFVIMFEKKQFFGQVMADGRLDGLGQIGTLYGKSGIQKRRLFSPASTALREQASVRAGEARRRLR